MRVWLINSAEATPLDAGGIRLRRTPLLARALLDRGHEVLWWNADFFHATKKHRFGQDKTVEVESRYTIRFIHGPGYQKHISLARVWAHRVIAKRFLTQAESLECPDVILSSLPTPDLIDAATRFGKKYGIPVVLDIRDIWPDLIVEAAPRFLRPLANWVLTPYHFMVQRACCAAAAFVSNTPKFIEWGLAKSRRSKSDDDQDFPFGYEEPEMSEDDKKNADAFWRSQGIVPKSNQPVVAYIGMIGQNFQDDIIVRAAEKVWNRRQATFVFCGGGDRLDELRKKYAGNRNIVLPGWVNAKQLWRLMGHTSIALASYKESENLRSSLTNKTIEYMAGGLPVLFSIDDGYVADLIRSNEIGLTYGGSADRLAESIIRLLDDEPYRKKLSENSRNLYLKRYRSETIYPRMAEHLERIVRQYIFKTK